MRQARDRDTLQKSRPATNDSAHFTVLPLTRAICARICAVCARIGPSAALGREANVEFVRLLCLRVIENKVISVAERITTVKGRIEVNGYRDWRQYRGQRTRQSVKNRTNCLHVLRLSARLRGLSGLSSGNWQRTSVADERSDISEERSDEKRE